MDIASLTKRCQRHHPNAVKIPLLAALALLITIASACIKAETITAATTNDPPSKLAQAASTQHSTQPAEPAVMQYIAAQVPSAAVVGTARMRYLFWDVYDAELFAPAGVWASDEPYALSLTYLRSLKGAAIAQRSVEEMQQQGYNDQAKLAEWQQAMTELFPNVDKQSNLTGIRTATGDTVFYYNHEFLGAVQDPQFSQRFFAIWLSEKTSEPTLRQALLGLPAGEK